MPHITIIGGGIASLATAFYLQKKNQNLRSDENIHYTLIESDTRWGGKIVTDVIDNFVVEGGPDSFITQKPWGIQLCRDLGLDDRLIPTNDDLRNVFILKKGKLVPFPGGFRLAIPTETIPFAFSSLISPWGKLRMAMDLFIPPRQGQSDESLASFIGRRLGREALDKIGGPMMAGIYVADPERLSIQSTFPNFVDIEQKHGSLIKGMRAAKKKRRSSTGNDHQPPAMFTSLQGGMSELVEALVSQLKGDLRLGCRATGLKYLSPGFEVTVNQPESQRFTTDVVVLAVPAYIAAALVAPAEPELAKLLKQIRYVSSATVSLGYRQADVAQHDFNGFGFMIPKSENRSILACTWFSTKFNHRASNEDILLRVFVGGDGQEHLVEDVADEALIAIVQAELADIMGLKARPVVSKIFRWPKGNPQYDVGHLDRVARIEAMTAGIPGLYLTGSAFRGIGTPDCIGNAITNVDQISKHFKQDILPIRST